MTSPDADGRLRLRGIERWTVELTGSIPADALASPGPDVPLAEPGGEIEVGLLVFAMQRLGLRGVPGLGLGYREALWRIGVRLDGAPAWWAHTCDLDRALVRAFGRRLIRYPTRPATLALNCDDDRWQLAVEADAAALRVTLSPTETEPPPEPPRPVIVIDDGRRFSVPWDETPAPYRRVATVHDVEDTLSPATFGTGVRWDSTALVHRGRTHHCGFATAR